MMTAWRLLPGLSGLPGRICAPMDDEAVYSCIGNCIAAQQRRISFTCTLQSVQQQQPSRLAGKIRCPMG